MTYVPRLAQSNHSWLGDGGVVYTTGYKPNTPFADNPALQRLQKPYKDAQAQRRASQALDKAVRLANRKGNVTVYDAVKRQYVSATPEEASFIRKVNKEVASQRRLAQVRQQGTGNVTVYDAVNKRYVSATPQQAKEIEFVNKNLEKARQLSKSTPSSPSIIDHNLGFDKTPKSAQESMGVFIKRDVEQALRQRTPLSPEVLDHNLGFDRVAKSARESVETFKPENIVKQQTIQPKYGLQEFIDRSNGIGTPAKSAQESMGVYIKRDIEQALSGKTPVSQGILDSRLGVDKAVK